ncbi:MAG TPA: hypothetical protein VMU84_04965 [Thermoanaerobaculia bacterium]|nr:hypothetical protein [Thermoanaerobaculia bacterium]
MKTRIVLMLLLSTLIATIAGAQTQTKQYAAKFICGKADGANPAAPGVYWTAINVHNPLLRKEITFVKKFTIGLPKEKVGKISTWFRGILRADETLQIDCVDIWAHLSVPAGSFVEGFAVIQPSSELDVVGVYTAAPPNGGVSTMQMERVPLRLTQ